MYAIRSYYEAVRERVRQEYNLDAVVERLEQVYQDAWVGTHRREIPVLMYHRFIRDQSEKGVHGTWLPVAMLDRITSYNVCYTKLLRD